MYLGINYVLTSSANLKFHADTTCTSLQASTFQLSVRSFSVIWSPHPFLRLFLNFGSSTTKALCSFEPTIPPRILNTSKWPRSSLLCCGFPLLSFIFCLCYLSLELSLIHVFLSLS